MLVEDGQVRGLSMHLDRLVDDCRALFGFELDPQRVRDFVKHAVDTQVVIARVTIFAPNLELGTPGRGLLNPQVLVSTRAATGHALPPLRLQSVHYQRELAEVKHVGLFATVHRRRAAQLAGYDDVVFVDGDSRISEGATWNIGFIEGDTIVWPVADRLPGVTARLLQDAYARQGGNSAHREVDLADAKGMDAAFVTNAAVGVRPVARVDNHVYPQDTPQMKVLIGVYAGVPTETI
jgi:branched-subunit amino acid aminotransferase/4-amino-4-deoxychorismate lyase